MNRRRGDANSDSPQAGRDPGGIESEGLEPIGVVERELTRPDGTKVVALVPVYPPFRLKERPAGRAPAPARKRGAPSLRKTPRSTGGAKG